MKKFIKKFNKEDVLLVLAMTVFFAVGGWSMHYGYNLIQSWGLAVIFEWVSYFVFKDLYENFIE